MSQKPGEKQGTALQNPLERAALFELDSQEQETMTKFH